MAFAALTGAWATWWLNNRHGGLPTGTFGSALPSDLLVGDYVVGMRSTVASLGNTNAGVRSVTFSRPGVPNYTVGMRTADPIHVIRP